MRRERRDPAMARQVIPERGETPDLIATRHAVLLARSGRTLGTPYSLSQVVDERLV
jgi:hypothetical protein